MRQHRIIYGLDIAVKKLLDAVNSECERFGMKISITKTKYMLINKAHNVAISNSVNNEQLKRINQFR